MRIANPKFMAFPFRGFATLGSLFESTLLNEVNAPPPAGRTEALGPAKVSRHDVWGLIRAIRAESRFVNPASPEIARRRFATLVAKISRA